MPDMGRHHPQVRYLRRLGYLLCRCSSCHGFTDTYTAQKAIVATLLRPLQLFLSVRQNLDGVPVCLRRSRPCHAPLCIFLLRQRKAFPRTSQRFAEI